MQDQSITTKNMRTSAYWMDLVEAIEISFGSMGGETRDRIYRLANKPEMDAESFIMLVADGQDFWPHGWQDEAIEAAVSAYRRDIHDNPERGW